MYELRKFGGLAIPSQTVAMVFGYIWIHRDTIIASIPITPVKLPGDSQTETGRVWKCRAPTPNCHPNGEMIRETNNDKTCLGRSFPTTVPMCLGFPRILRHFLDVWRTQTVKISHSPRNSESRANKLLQQSSQEGFRRTDCRNTMELESRSQMELHQVDRCP